MDTQRNQPFSREEIERRKKQIKDTLLCPYCGHRLRKWAVPQTPFTTWPNEYMYICFNDECEYLVKGREGTAPYGTPMCRLLYDPLQDCCQPIPVPNLRALRDGIMEEDQEGHPMELPSITPEPAFSPEAIVGSWHLVSFEIRTEARAPAFPLGSCPQGFLMYTSDGYLSVQNMLPPETTLTNNALAAAEVYGTFNGRYEIRGNRIIHHIGMSSIPSWSGRDLERTLTIEGGRLVLIGLPMDPGPAVSRVRMIWKRAA